MFIAITVSTMSKRGAGLHHTPRVASYIKELFSGLKGLLIFNGHISSSFSTSEGSGQGRILAPFLYCTWFTSIVDGTLSI